VDGNTSNEVLSFDQGVIQKKCYCFIRLNSKEQSILDELLLRSIF